MQATTQGTNGPTTDTRVLTVTTSVGSWSVPLEFSTWNDFHTATLPGVVVGTDGKIEISASLSLSAGAWGVFDDVRLSVQSTTESVDKAALATAVANAKAVDRSPYRRLSRCS
ncbi:hypothetical protein [Mycetocola sp. 2940]|uniref:hypothetical protein n=1 Tax=Mycetocola sp. 2940 TaxID=3156452 RepID=UPI003392209F